jgi:hypothetical protein
MSIDLVHARREFDGAGQEYEWTDDEQVEYVTELLGGEDFGELTPEQRLGWSVAYIFESNDMADVLLRVLAHFMVVEVPA